MEREKTGNWYLESKLKDNSPSIVPLNKQIFTIGRSDSCDLILNNAVVSRVHSRIFFDMSDPYIKDLNSRNGTYVNGSPIQTEVRLQDRDIIKIGPVNLTIRSSEILEEENEGTLIEDNEIKERDYAEFYNISKREYDVLYFLLQGDSIKDIAKKLFISNGTAKNHALNIYKKTNCHTRIELANHFRNFSDKAD